MNRIPVRADNGLFAGWAFADRTGLNHRPDKMYQFADFVRRAFDQDGGILFDLQRGRFLRVNRTGSLVLQGIEAGQSEWQIAQTVARQYSMELNLIHSHVSRFCQTLKDCHLITDHERRVAS